MNNINPFEIMAQGAKTLYNIGPTAWIVFSVIFLVLLYIAKKLVPAGADWIYYRRHPIAKLMDERKERGSGVASRD